MAQAQHRPYSLRRRLLRMAVWASAAATPSASGSTAASSSAATTAAAVVAATVVAAAAAAEATAAAFRFGVAAFFLLTVAPAAQLQMGQAWASCCLAGQCCSSKPDSMAGQSSVAATVKRPHHNNNVKHIQTVHFPIALTGGSHENLNIVTGSVCHAVCQCHKAQPRLREKCCEQSAPGCLERAVKLT